MNADQISSLVRSVMSIGGTTLAAHGVTISAVDWQTITGAAVVVASIIWSQVFHAKNGA